MHFPELSLKKELRALAGPRPSLFSQRFFQAIVVSSFLATASLFLLYWSSFLGLNPSSYLLFYLTFFGAALAFFEEFLFRFLALKVLGPKIQLALFLAYSLLLAFAFVPSKVSFAASSLLIALVATVLAARFGFFGALFFKMLFLVFSALGFFSLGIVFSLLVFLAPFAFLQARRRSVAETALLLSMRWNRLRESIGSGAKLFLIIFLMLFFEGLALNAFGFLDTEKVAAVVKQQPLVGLAIAVTLAPLGEELFFRGFLQKRFGVLLSSVLFAWLHLSYGSIAEIVAAFTVSVALGLWLRREDNVFSCVFAHSFYNLFSITLISFFA